MKIKKLSIEDLEYIDKCLPHVQFIKHACMSKINEIIDFINKNSEEITDECIYCGQNPKGNKV